MKIEREYRLLILTIEGYKDSAALLRLLINDYIKGSGTAHHTQLHIKTFTHKKTTYAAAILESEKTLGTRLTKISPARVASGLQSTNKPVSSPGPLTEVLSRPHRVYPPIKIDWKCV